MPVASEPEKIRASFIGSDMTDERNEKMRDGERGHRAGSRWTNECLCHGAKRVFVKFPVVWDLLISSRSPNPRGMTLLTQLWPTL